MLIRRYEPDYLLVHPMGMDHAGHMSGSDSEDYLARALGIDGILAIVLPQWLERGYRVMVTGDHGMTPHRTHGATTADSRNVPFYVIRPDLAGRGKIDGEVSHLSVAPTVLESLGLSVPGAMKGGSLA